MGLTPNNHHREQSLTALLSLFHISSDTVFIITCKNEPVTSSMSRSYCRRVISRLAETTLTEGHRRLYECTISGTYKPIRQSCIAKKMGGHFTRSPTALAENSRRSSATKATCTALSHTASSLRLNSLNTGYLMRYSRLYEKQVRTQSQQPLPPK